MVDKLFIVKSPRSLRCSPNIFPMLCPIHIGPLFHQGFHTRDGLDFLLAHGHGPVRPVKPRLLFLSSSEANNAVDSLAKIGSAQSELFVSLVTPSLSVMEVLNYDSTHVATSSSLFVPDTHLPGG